MSNIKKVRSTRPTKIFLLEQIIKSSGLLNAAMIGDLYYWICKGESPWRNAHDFADWFHVSDQAILNHSKELSERLQYLSRNRTRMKKGHRGAYSYCANKTPSSKNLTDIYANILSNASINRDFGEFDPNCDEYKEIPTVQLLLIDTIELVGCYKQAYILDRISWALVAREQEQLFFRSKQHFDEWASLGDKTGQRLLKKLNDNGFTFTEECNGQFLVSARQDTSSYEFFTSYMADKAESRKEAIAGWD